MTTRRGWLGGVRGEETHGVLPQSTAWVRGASLGPGVPSSTAAGRSGPAWSLGVCSGWRLCRPDVWPLIRAGVSTSPQLPADLPPSPRCTAVPAPAVPTSTAHWGTPGSGRPRVSRFGPRPLQVFRVSELPSRTATGSFRLRPRRRLGARCFSPKRLRTAPALPSPLAAQRGCDSSFVRSAPRSQCVPSVWARGSDSASHRT